MFPMKCQYSKKGEIMKSNKYKGKSNFLGKLIAKERKSQKLSQILASTKI